MAKSVKRTNKKSVARKPSASRTHGTGDFAGIRILDPVVKPKRFTVQQIRKAVREVYGTKRLVST